MSHITRLKTVIKDEQCLAKTLEYLKIPFIHNASTGTFQLVLSTNTHFDVTMLVKRTNKSEPYMFFLDDLSRPAIQNLVNKIQHKGSFDDNPSEKFLEIVQQRYAVEEFIKTAKEKGHNITVTATKQGDYEIEVSVPDLEVQV